MWKTRYRLLYEENADLVSRVDTAQSSLEECAQQAREREKTIANTESEITVLSRINQDLEASISELRSWCKSRNDSLSEKEDEIRDLTRELNLTLVRIHELETQKQDLQIQCAKMASENEIVNSRLETCLANCSGLSEEVRTLQDKADALTTIKDSLSIPGEIYHQYEWYYLHPRSWSKGVSGKKGTGFNRTEYMYLAAGRHGKDSDMDSFLRTMNIDSDDIQELADHLYSQAATDSQRANNILKFVQFLPYIHDSPEGGYPRHPLETLVEGGGDCEDKSLLAAYLLNKSGPEGYPVCLFRVDTNGDDRPDHMMTGVSISSSTGERYVVDGVEYLPCETTGTGYRVGQMPSGYTIYDSIVIGG